jgi:chorismate dehydratase
VRSVLLVSSVSREKIRSVRLDPASRTSAALVRILLKRRYGLSPEVRESEADAELVIGDPALKADLQGRVALDLASEWRGLTGFPFVFAFWAVRSGVFTTSLRDALFEAYRSSMANFEAMVASEKLSPAMVEDYLRHCLHYELTEADEKGLDLFARWAREDGLL